jgi:2-succinyl-6-hydroxy-2,4-cyclohexadiene-1-carboxylate synthase
MTILLHGFWGQPADWNEVLRHLPLHEAVLTPDLYEPGPLAPHHPLKDWTAHFLEWVQETSPNHPVQLVGYSMGGRLALSAAIKNPALFSRVLIVSGAPGLWKETPQDRESWEMTWRERFQTQPWAELESLWQEQSVFAQTKGLARRKSNQLREMLGQSLVNWSPREHEFSLENMKSLPLSLEWAFGALDQKYMGWAKALQELSVQGQIHIIPNAGHRIPGDSPEFIARWIERGSKT